MMYFHSYRKPGLVLDLVEGMGPAPAPGRMRLCALTVRDRGNHGVDAADIRRINDTAVFAKRTGMIILGGGLVKHHTCNANLMVSTRRRPS